MKALNVVGISTQRYYDWKANPAKYDGRTHPNRAGIITNQQTLNMLNCP